MNRLKAFTIMEVIVVLLLSTIVTGIAYLSYTVVARQFGRFSHQNGEINRMLLLDRALSADIAKSEALVRKQNGFDAIRGDTVVSYRMDSLLVRSQNASVTDTFKIAVDSIIFKFEQVPQHLPGALIDELKICFRSEGQHFELLKRKWYSASELLQYSHLMQYSHEWN